MHRGKAVYSVRGRGGQRRGNGAVASNERKYSRPTCVADDYAVTRPCNVTRVTINRFVEETSRQASADKSDSLHKWLVSCLRWSLA